MPGAPRSSASASMRGWWRPMQVTVQKASAGSGRNIASRASGEASMPPGTPKTRLMRSGGGSTPSSNQRTALTTWPTSNASTSSAMPAFVAFSMIPRPGRGRGDEGLVAEVHRSGLDARRCRGSPRGRWCARRSSCRWRRPVETMVSRSEPLRMRSITSTNSSGRPLGVPSSSRTCRWTTVAPAVAGVDRVGGDLLGRVGDVGIVLAEDVGAGDGDREDDGIAAPGHQAFPSAAKAARSGALERISSRA